MAAGSANPIVCCTSGITNPFGRNTGNVGSESQNSVAVPSVVTKAWRGIASRKVMTASFGCIRCGRAAGSARTVGVAARAYQATSRGATRPTSASASSAGSACTAVVAG